VLLNRSRLALALTGAAGMVSLTACAMFLPSRPITDEVHMRNGQSGVEVLFCETGEVAPIVISVGEQRMDGDLLPVSPSPVSVVAGRAVPLAELADLPEGSERLGSVAAGDQLELAVRLDAGQSAPLIEAQFLVSPEVIESFAQGFWLSPTGSLRADPCSGV